MAKNDVWVQSVQTVIRSGEDSTVRFANGFKVFSRAGIELGAFQSLAELVHWMNDERIHELHWIGGDGNARHIMPKWYESTQLEIWAQVVTLESSTNGLGNNEHDILSHITGITGSDLIAGHRSVRLVLMYLSDGSLLGVSTTLAGAIAVIKDNDASRRRLYWIDDAGNCSESLPIWA